jgi:DNA-binding SARP family transcriptional activator
VGGLELHLLGGLLVRVDGTELPPLHAHGPLALLGWLALNPGAHSRGTVAGKLWPGFVDVSARNSLRTALSALRGYLGPGADRYLVASRNAIGLASENVTVDLAEFERLRQQHRYEAAIDLCRGELLAGLHDGWALAARQEHNERVGELMSRLTVAAVRRSDHEQAIRWARRRLALEPLAEDSLRVLMRLLAADGRRAEALSIYSQLRERLGRELSMAPSTATRQLAGELRRPRPGMRDPAFVLQPLDLPPRLRARQRTRFVGRSAELGRLGRSWRRARAGELQFALIAGSPGVGKSRLAAELASVSGASTLYGSCVKEGGAAYHAFVEALRPLVCVLPPLALERVGPHLSGLMPELTPEAQRNGTPDPGDDPPAACRLIFAAVADIIATACASRPTLLVLDDLHWADPATLLLLEHTVRSSAGRPLLVLGTYRDDALATTPRLAATLGELRREVPYDRVSLTSLTTAETGELTAAWLGAALPPALVGTIQRWTDGNPFLVEEFLRDLVDAIGDDPGPLLADGVGEEALASELTLEHANSYRFQHASGHDGPRGIAGTGAASDGRRCGDPA